MSTSAVKPTMPGVGTSQAATTHSILPINPVAQKVVQSTEAGTMKPLTGSGLSYTTLQPPNQPLSLVQDHRPPIYQPPPYIGSSSDKEVEAEKLLTNGIEVSKKENEEETLNIIKQVETNTNNNINSEATVSEENLETQSKVTEGPIVTTDLPTSNTQVQGKIDEKKIPLNNGSKEAEGTPISTNLQKTSFNKSNESLTKNDISVKPKAAVVSINPSNEINTSSLTSSLTKTEAKSSVLPKINKRKPRELKDLKSTATGSDGYTKPKRNRIQTQPYQSPLPDIALLVKNLNKSPTIKTNDDKLIVFYKNEFLAVRNAEGSFFVCQAMQNVYKSSRRIRIRWLSQDKNNGEIYSPDFYDYIDFDCILTNLNLNKIDKNKFQLTKIELLRTENILKRAIDVEAGVSEKPRVTEEHPDGLDLSLYKDESQLKKRKSLTKQRANQRKKSRRSMSTSDEDDSQEEDSDKKSLKYNRSKKQSINKALVLAKSVAKGPSRAERALNRSTKNNTPSTGDDMTSSNPAATETLKNSADVKKAENKKSVKSQNNNSTSGIQRTQKRANTAQSSDTATRPKRIVTNTTSTPSEEVTALRKKSRGRA
ncbi:kinesin-related protein 8-like [Prorops nasuta]|uniref:kinesin-related protein 8-like n=1 Tax=Prorops nasuta TaxID=863751 RepID=UPI0034CF5C09